MFRFNYGEYEQQGECADDLTYEHIPEALGILSSYELPFANNIYFRDSNNPVTLVINLFKPDKDTRLPLTAKHYTELTLSLYEKYLKKQKQEDIKPKSITANKYVYEMLGLWATKNAKNIDPFLSSSHL